MTLYQPSAWTDGEVLKDGLRRTSILNVKRESTICSKYKYTLQTGIELNASVDMLIFATVSSK